MKKRFKIYGDHETRKVWLNDKLIDERKSQAVYNHSPDGFSWGYTGSGPMQLGLAIMLELFPEDAVKMYRDFTINVIAHIPQGNDFSAEIIVQEMEGNETLFKFSDDQKN
jgi:hypothetical protein